MNVPTHLGTFYFDKIPRLCWTGIHFSIKRWKITVSALSRGNSGSGSEILLRIAIPLRMGFSHSQRNHDSRR